MSTHSDEIAEEYRQAQRHNDPAECLRLFELWWRSMKDHFGSPDEFVRAWFMSNGFPEGSIFRRYLMGFSRM